MTLWHMTSGASSLGNKNVGSDLAQSLEFCASNPHSNPSPLNPDHIIGFHGWVEVLHSFAKEGRSRSQVGAQILWGRFNEWGRLLEKVDIFEEREK